MQKITPFLWFDGCAEEAIRFYTSVFKNAIIGNIVRYGKGGPAPEGSIMTATFQLEGLNFIALNGSPVFNFTPAISFVVNCDTQEEIDYFWEQLSAGGEKQKCGWVKDRFGISWQIVPSKLAKLLQTSDTKKKNHVMNLLMQMDKLDIEQLERVYTESDQSTSI